MDVYVDVEQSIGEIKTDLEIIKHEMYNITSVPKHLLLNHKRKVKEE